MWELRNMNTSASILIVCNLKVFSDVWQLLWGCSEKASNQSSVPESANTLETATNRSSLCWWKAIVRICHSYPATLSISLVSWLQTSQSQASLESGTVRQEKGQVGCHAQQHKQSYHQCIGGSFVCNVQLDFGGSAVAEANNDSSNRPTEIHVFDSLMKSDGNLGRKKRLPNFHSQVCNSQDCRINIWQSEIQFLRLS